MMINKLLIIAPYQFGELSDCYYWAKYAMKDGIDVTYIGYRYKQRNISPRKLDGLRDKSVMHYENRVLLGIVFYLTCIWEIIFRRHKNIIICNMPYCEVLPLVFPSRNIIFDIRTLSVDEDSEVRDRFNAKLNRKKEFFKTCTVVSEGVGRKIDGSAKLLPLGAESLSNKVKDFSELRFFYIGTFNGRNLSEFILGLAKFQIETGVRSTFDIVGGGTPEEEAIIRKSIIDSKVSGVKLYGYLTHDEAVSFFDACNVGVCYVPITEYYQHQPPTKLYEYLLSGMSCIATQTISNAEVINDSNGVLIMDNPESVSEGLKKLYDNRLNYNSNSIVKSSESYHWKDIVRNYLEKYLIL